MPAAPNICAQFHARRDCVLQTTEHFKSFHFPFDTAALRFAPLNKFHKLEAVGPRCGPAARCLHLLVLNGSAFLHSSREHGPENFPLLGNESPVSQKVEINFFLECNGGLFEGHVWREVRVQVSQNAANSL